MALSAGPIGLNSFHESKQARWAASGNFVVALADSPLFDIDKNNLTATLPNIETTGGGGATDFANRFSMHLKLKAPIVLRPEPAAAPPSSSSFQSLKPSRHEPDAEQPNPVGG